MSKDNLDLAALGMNPNMDAWAELDKLQEMLRTGEGFEPDSEVAKLHEWYTANNVKKLHISLAPEFKGTAEDLAREQNKIHAWLQDPVNNLISRMGGVLFMKEDYVACTEGRKKVTEDGFVDVPMTEEEQRKVLDYKADIALYREATEMLKSLTSVKDGWKWTYTPAQDAGGSKVNYLAYPPFINMSIEDGKLKIIIRGHEVEHAANSDWLETGPWVEIYLPIEALEDLQKSFLT